MSILSSRADSETGPSPILFLKTPPLSSDIEIAAKSEHIDASFDHKTMRRIHWRLLPLLGTLHALAFIDKTNMGVARLTGMGDDLVCILAHFG
ncbi:hypothetical protein IW262DRAFT_1390248 [Armillaria fumosa]|nr:hypothetical protein IW262DRAFT_1390248 [Armillaria fumosa]